MVPACLTTVAHMSDQGDAPAESLYRMSGYREVARDTPLSARQKGVRPRILLHKSVGPWFEPLSIQFPRLP